MVKSLLLSLCSFLLSVIKCNATRPHIIFILADDMGWNDVTFHGSDQIPTPNIDALAYNSVILNNMYGMQVCTPSRTALMTGKYPIHLGLQGEPLSGAQPRGLPLKEKLLPEYLKDLGYTTRMIGKWHLGFYRQPYIPLNRGFDSHFGYYNGNMGYYDHIYQEKFAYPIGDLSGVDLRDNRTIRYDLEGRYATDLFTEEAERLIEEHRSTEPLFLYMAHQAVHSGNDGALVEAPREAIDKFSYIIEPNRRTYAAMVSKLDESVGRIVAALSRKRMLENSIIVFMSDNGAPSEIPSKGPYTNWGSNFPFRGIKDTLWSGGVRSPSFIWSPCLQKNPRISTQLMHVSDWLPTLISAAGGNSSMLPKNLDGIDQWASIEIGRPSSRRYLLININEQTKLAAIVMHSWKLVVGSYANGTMDGFYGDESKYPGPPYKLSTIKKSIAYKELTALSQRRALPISDKDRMRAMRHGATVQCNNSNRIDSSPCPEGLCLFNLETDPCETINLAKSYFNIASHLFDVLKFYESGLVPQMNAPEDPLNADPVNFNNSWQSWVA